MTTKYILDFEENEVKSDVKFKKVGLRKPNRKASRPVIEKKIYVPNIVNDEHMLPPLKNQEEHISKILECLSSWAYFFDFSIPGSGKTHIALLVAKYLGLDALLVAPPGTFNHWETISKRIGVNIIDKISYQSLASSVGNTLNHPYLNRKYDGKNLIFEHTDHFDQILEKGILLIFDESSMTKNDTNRTIASAALMRRISCQFEKMPDEFKSRFIQLSGTPISNVNQMIVMLRNLGLISTTNVKYLVQKRGNDIIPTGMNLLKEKCEKIDYYQTQYIISKLSDNIGKENVYKVLISLYVEVLKPHISGGLPGPDLSGINLDIKNKFYRIDEDKLEKLDQDIRSMTNNMDLMYSIKGDRFNRKGNAYSIRIRCNQEKDDIIINKILKTLKKDPNRKIIILSKYVEILKIISEKLRHHKKDGVNSRYVTGDINIHLRNKFYDLFNEDSNKCNVLLLSKVGFHGINLQDTHGNRSRLILFLPDNDMEDTYQGIHRAYRVGAMSDCKVRMVYIYGLDFELRVIAALSRQSRANKMMLSEEVLDNTIYPDEFDCVSEGNYEYQVEMDSINQSQPFETYDVYRH